MREMTKTEMYLQARAQGLSCTEVAEMFGTSRQNVSFLTCKHMPKEFRGWNKDNCVYPNLRKWLNDHRMSVSVLQAKLNVPRSTVYTFCRGENAYCAKSTIDAFLRVTGMTYAELFEEDTKC